jgi:hypothetical protein
MAYVFEDTQVDVLPAILVDVGDYQSATLPVFSNVMRLDEGERETDNTVKTTVTWHHVAKDPFQAVNHAACTYDLFDAFSQEIKDGLCLIDFTVKTLSRPVLRKDKPASWSSQVVADVEFGEGGVVKRESPKLKQVTVKVIVSGPLTLTQEYNTTR